MSFFRSGLTVMHTDRTALVALSVAALGAFGLGILLSALVPQLAESSTATGGTMPTGMQEFFATTFAEKDVLRTALAVFLVNLLAAAVVQTTLPSLVIPFLGTALVVLRMVVWGLIFTPVGESDPGFLVHWVTLLVEGAAYVLAGFAAFVHARMVIQPARYGIEGRGRAYLRGLLATAQIYVWIVILLVVGALYESITLIYGIA